MKIVAFVGQRSGAMHSVLVTEQSTVVELVLAMSTVQVNG